MRLASSIVVHITTRAELRACKKLRFCYACGLPLGLPGDTGGQDEDHVPPKGLFAVLDRDPPLKLPTHVACNNLRSRSDERVGQWVALLHKSKVTRADVSSLHIRFGALPGTTKVVPYVDGLLLRETIAFWIRGFHAALYQQPTPSIFRGRFVDPFPSSDDRQSLEPLRPQDALFVDIIKQHRRIDRLDVVECYNGKCRYECVWPRFDDGRTFCLFSLDLYGWGDPKHTGLATSRSCTGFFFTPQPFGVPATATRATQLTIPASNFERFDAFGG
jgi:hypothetical protein